AVRIAERLFTRLAATRHPGASADEWSAGSTGSSWIWRPTLVTARPRGRPGCDLHQRAPTVRQLRAHRRLVRGRDRVEPRLHRPLGDDEPTGLHGQRAVQPWRHTAD